MSLPLLPSGSFVVLLGKQADLAWAELNALEPKAFLLEQGYVGLDRTADPEMLIRRLGGVVKVYTVWQATNPASLRQDVLQAVLAAKTETIAFSANFDAAHIKTVAKETKNSLRALGTNIRYRLLDSVYTSAGIGDDWTEISVVRIGGQWYIMTTTTAQDISYWSFKDYNRPGADPRSGMMPPKVARMLVNLALPDKTPAPNKMVYDPFCGSGTLLVEGLDLGFSVVGSDLSADAVDDARTNCAWFKEKTNAGGTYRVFQKDAAHVTLADIGSQVDAIVFEGYLGPPNPAPEKFDNLVKGLGKLYKGVLKTLYPLLKDEGFIVCALPEYHQAGRVKTLDHLIDAIEPLGYTRYGRFTYGRPKAVVKRTIYVLKKIVK